jgi:tetratricopeptide (TPR) repeat protein
MRQIVELFRMNLEAEKLASQNKIHEAIEKYEEIIDFRKQLDNDTTNLALLHYKKGVLLEQGKEKESAIQSYQQAIQLLHKSQKTRLYYDLVKKIQGESENGL